MRQELFYRRFRAIDRKILFERLYFKAFRHSDRFVFTGTRARLNARFDSNSFENFLPSCFFGGKCLMFRCVTREYGTFKVGIDFLLANCSPKCPDMVLIVLLGVRLNYFPQHIGDSKTFWFFVVFFEFVFSKIPDRR